MRKFVSALALAALLVSAFGCGPQEKKAPEGKETGASRVRAVSSGGGSLLPLVQELEKEVERLEEASKKYQNKPFLEDKVHEFDLTAAPSKGPDDAKLVLVEFSDFECPFCKRFSETAEKLLERFPEDLKVVFMNFPLDPNCNTALSRPFHRKACMAANAAMAAAEQGKFWEMHDWLFANQRSFDEDKILEFARSQGMDTEAIKKAIDENKYKDLLESQAKQLLPTGSRGTPTIFINGRKVMNARWSDLDSVTEFFEELINPEAAKEEKPRAEAVVAEPGSLRAAEVVLDDGTLLSERLSLLKQRLEKIEMGQAGRQTPSRPSKPDPNKVYSFNLKDRPSLGPENAPITIVEFSDFMCPFCAKLAPEIKKLREKFPDKLRIVFKGIPNRGHRYSLEALFAALAAKEQGKFWEMHDRIFQNQQKVNPEFLENAAKELGLDMDKFKSDQQEEKLRNLILGDLNDARNASVSSTPTVFINGKWQQDRSLEAMTKTIEKILAQ